MKNFKYLFYICSLISCNVFATKSSKPAPKPHNNSAKSVLKEDVTRLTPEKKRILTYDLAQKRIKNKIDPNLSPDQIAERLNKVLDFPLYKDLMTVVIKSKIDGKEQSLIYQKCFLKGYQGAADINRWIAPGYSKKRERFS